MTPRELLFDLYTVNAFEVFPIFLFICSVKSLNDSHRELCLFVGEASFVSIYNDKSKKIKCREMTLYL
jgi:hypothetical protein